MDTQADFVQWAIGQGVAVAVLAFVLVRLDGRIVSLAKSIDELAAWLHGVANGHEAISLSKTAKLPRTDGK